MKLATQQQGTTVLTNVLMNRIVAIVGWRNTTLVIEEMIILLPFLRYNDPNDLGQFDWNFLFPFSKLDFHFIPSYAYGSFIFDFS